MTQTARGKQQKHVWDQELGITLNQIVNLSHHKTELRGLTCSTAPLTYHRQISPCRAGQGMPHLAGMRAASVLTTDTNGARNFQGLDA